MLFNSFFWLLKIYNSDSNKNEDLIAPQLNLRSY